VAVVRTFLLAAAAHGMKYARIMIVNTTTIPSNRYDICLRGPSIPKPDLPGETTSFNTLAFAGIQPVSAGSRTSRTASVRDGQGHAQAKDTRGRVFRGCWAALQNHLPTWPRSGLNPTMVGGILFRYNMG
jgi:hypothetical protein